MTLEAAKESGFPNTPGRFRTWREQSGFKLWDIFQNETNIGFLKFTWLCILLYFQET